MSFYQYFMNFHVDLCYLFSLFRARFQLSSGPGSQGTIAAQFNCEGTTLSGVEFELVGSGYRVSLVKRRFVSGNSTVVYHDRQEYQGFSISSSFLSGSYAFRSAGTLTISKV